ncbi:MAG: IPTL-CTERM sorting domain-containing protein, partial [Porticoccaceae bacterium]
IEWRMVWINRSLIAAEDVVISDAIRAGMTFIDGSLVCEARGSSSYSACDFEAPDPTYPQGRILVAADLGPDFGHSDEAGAENELVVTFRVAVAREASPVNYENEAESSWTPPGEDDPIVDQSTPDPDGDGPSTVEVPPRPTAVPTLSHAGLMLLALLMAMLGRRHLRRG